MRYTCLVILGLTAAACGQTTPKYGILYGIGDSGGQAQVGAINPNHIDAAFEAAANLLDLKAKQAAENGIVLELHGKAIAWGETFHAGQTIETLSKAVWYPCMFEARSAVLHEFVHSLLYIKNHDNDAQHTQGVWHDADGQRAALQVLCD